MAPGIKSKLAPYSVCLIVRILSDPIATCSRSRGCSRGRSRIRWPTQIWWGSGCQHPLAFGSLHGVGFSCSGPGIWLVGLGIMRDAGFHTRRTMTGAGGASGMCSRLMRRLDDAFGPITWIVFMLQVRCVAPASAIAGLTTILTSTFTIFKSSRESL
jgi:hypothetical protein